MATTSKTMNRYDRERRSARAARLDKITRCISPFPKKPFLISSAPLSFHPYLLLSLHPCLLLSIHPLSPSFCAVAMPVQSRMHAPVAMSPGQGESPVYSSSQHHWSPNPPPAFESRRTHLSYDLNSPRSSGFLATYDQNPCSSMPISVHSSRNSGTPALNPDARSHISISSDDSDNGDSEILRLQHEVNKLKTELIRAEGRLDSSVCVYSFIL